MVLALYYHMYDCSSLLEITLMNLGRKAAWLQRKAAATGSWRSLPKKRPIGHDREIIFDMED